MEHFWEPSWQWGSALCHLSPVARIMGHFSEVEFCNVGSQGRGLYLWLTISKFRQHLTYWCQYCLNLSSQKITISPPKNMNFHQKKVILWSFQFHREHRRRELLWGDLNVWLFHLQSLLLIPFPIISSSHYEHEGNMIHYIQIWEKHLVAH